MALVEKLRCGSAGSPGFSPLVANLRLMDAFAADRPFASDDEQLAQEAHLRAYAQSHKYKTEMCRNFELGRACRWGAQCCFAHGKEELRSRAHFSHHYKTKICKHYHRLGLCPYGPRCQYFHLRSHQIYAELLDSLERKLFLKSAEAPSEELGALLGRSERL